MEHNWTLGQLKRPVRPIGFADGFKGVNWDLLSGDGGIGTSICKGDNSWFRVEE